ncbi:MAG TPA: DMT family protein [Gemmatimonadaceae bacterium]|nr:DMT family protein [Gemmatimonadaceae bacterium]
MVLFRTATLLIISNVFMTFAWYGHLRWLHDRKWYVAVVLSWGIAFFEYMFMIPANRIGATELSLPQLKILQEAVTLTVFVPFAVVVMRQQPRWDFLWAGLCLVAAVFFVFRSHVPG